MTGKTHTPDGPVFADITDEVDAMLAEPRTAEFIESQRPAREAMNRAFAMNLAPIRKAAGVDAATITITVTVKGLDYSFDLTHMNTPEHDTQNA